MGMPVSGKLTAKPLPHIPALKAYTPGIQPTDKGWIKLNTNELPYPPSPKVAEAILNELKDKRLPTYGTAAERKDRLKK